MPEYLYRCKNCRAERDRVERMLWGTAIVCECGTVMHRVPQPLGVNWGGKWTCEMHPNSNFVIDGAEQRREEMTPNVASPILLPDGTEL